MSQIECTALILHSKAFFESDHRLECISPTLGKFHCLVKSASKTAFKKGQPCHPLSQVTFQLFKGKSFYIVNQCDTLQHFEHIRLSFNHLQYAFFFISIIQKSVLSNQNNPELYTLLCNTLTQCNQLQPTRSIAQSFYQAYLEIEGITPEKTTPQPNTLLHCISQYIGYPLKTPPQLDEHPKHQVK